MDRFAKLTPLALGLVCLACPSGSKQAPPPDEGTELASAAPRALGALAGGTDAAPPAVFVPRPQYQQEPESLPVPELEADGGAEVPDASAVEGDELPL
jgi:hypothetical protein